MPITLSNYPTLYKYGLLSQNGITNISGGNITIGIYNSSYGDGCYGNVDGIGEIDSSLSFVGTNGGLDQTDVSTANNELTELVLNINQLYPSTTTLNSTYGVETLVIAPNQTYDCPSPSLTFTGTTIQFDNSGNLTNPQYFIGANGTIDFTNVSFTYDSGVTPNNIFWIGSGITTQLTTTLYGTVISEVGSIDFNDNVTINGNLFIYISGSVSFGGDTIIQASSACYAKGTKILTTRGFQPIENLKENDKVITRGRIEKNKYHLKKQFKATPITWISKFKARNMTKHTAPICIRANALGENCPFEDLYVSPNHGILRNDELVPSSQLVNGHTIFQDFNHDSIEYYHLELETHSTILANGVLAESYLDCNNRHIFENSQKTKKLVMTK